MERFTTVLLDEQRAAWSSTSPWCEALLASLSADPETLDELTAAAARFGVPGTALDDWIVMDRQEALRRNSWPRPLRWIDLPARIAAGAPEEAEPPTIGRVLDSTAVEESYVSFTLSDEWLVTQDIDWAKHAAAGRIARRSPLLVEHRLVLYGAALLEFFLEQTLAVADGRPPNLSLLDRETLDVPKGQVKQNTIAALHAEWLTTPREDLAGRAPRQIIVDSNEHIDADLGDRELQWTRNLTEPAPIETTSFAYRCGGFSTTEAVLYFQLVREVAEHAWDIVRFGERPCEPPSRLRALEQLEQTKQEWLNTRRPEDIYTPAAMIDMQRRRLPLVLTGEQMMIDCECPICQELAKSEIPGFLHLDLSEPSNDFVFSLYSSRETWESDYEEWVDDDREFTRQQAARERN